MSRALLEVEGLRKHFSGRNGTVRAVNEVNLEVRRGETLGLVGESGCGKTTVGRSILRLIEPTSGRIWFDGKDISNLKDSALRPYRRRMQIVFQDPFGSLNPRMTVEQIVGEGMWLHGLCTGRVEMRRKVAALLERVGLPTDAGSKFPHEFSGGQRQRIGIARALAVEPEFIVCDEPVSALDVSVQAQIVNLLIDLQQERGLSYLFIAHDLAVVEHISHRVAVMYLGQIVEQASSVQLFAQPRHPYTRALLSAIPHAEPGKVRQREILQGEPPSPLNPPPGCPFAPRCPIVAANCHRALPALEERATGHRVRCPY